MECLQNKKKATRIGQYQPWLLSACETRDTPKKGSGNGHERTTAAGGLEETQICQRECQVKGEILRLEKQRGKLDPERYSKSKEHENNAYRFGECIKDCKPVEGVGDTSSAQAVISPFQGLHEPDREYFEQNVLDMKYMNDLHSGEALPPPSLTPDEQAGLDKWFPPTLDSR